MAEIETRGAELARLVEDLENTREGTVIDADFATPMASLLIDKRETERQTIISAVVAKTAGFSTPAVLDGGKFSFPQEAYVATARNFR